MKKSLLASSPFLIVNKSLLLSLGVDANLVLSHLYQQQQYFKENNQLINNMFFCTRENISCVTTLSFYQIKQAIATLVESGMIKMERKGIPARSHFIVYEDKILNFLKSSNEKTLTLDCEIFNNKISNKLNTINNNREIKIKYKKDNINIKEQFILDVKNLDNKQHHEDFIDYWTEENSRGKMRYQMEKTWNTSLRFKRWVKNNAKFNKQSKVQDPKFPDYYDIHFAKRLEQDHTALRSYYKHLESLGYEKKVNSYDGKIKWIKR